MAIMQNKKYVEGFFRKIKQVGIYDEDCKPIDFFPVFGITKKEAKGILKELDKEGKLKLLNNVVVLPEEIEDLKKSFHGKKVYRLEKYYVLNDFEQALVDSGYLEHYVKWVKNLNFKSNNNPLTDKDNIVRNLIFDDGSPSFKHLLLKSKVWKLSKKDILAAIDKFEDIIVINGTIIRKMDYDNVREKVGKKITAKKLYGKNFSKNKYLLEMQVEMLVSADAIVEELKWKKKI